MLICTRSTGSETNFKIQFALACPTKGDCYCRPGYKCEGVDKVLGPVEGWSPIWKMVVWRREVLFDSVWFAVKAFLSLSSQGDTCCALLRAVSRREGGSGFLFIVNV